MLATLTLETVGAERKPKQPVLSLFSSSGQPSRMRLGCDMCFVPEGRDFGK